jgi:hypothetical protein
MCALAALGVTVFTGDGRFAALMFGIGAGAIVVGGLLLLSGDEARVPALEAVTDLSAGAVVLAVGVVLVCLGGAWGLWLVWIGCGVLVVGGVVLVREWRAQREAVRR